MSKIYTKIVLDSSGKTLHEESFEWEGETALCFGGKPKMQKATTTTSQTTSQPELTDRERADIEGRTEARTARQGLAGSGVSTRLVEDAIQKAEESRRPTTTQTDQTQVQPRQPRGLFGLK